jgi:predicted Zn-dependent protease
MKQIRTFVLSILIISSANVHAFGLDLGGIDVSGIAKAIEGASELGGISEDEEIILGQEMAAGLLGAAGLVEDSELQAYVNKLGLWIAMQTDRPDLPWTFGVLDDDDINAFAAPGGYIFVTSGLFKIMRNEAELAGVLAHEISHVTAFHHVEAIQDQAAFKLAGGIAQVASRDDDDLVEYAMNATQELYTKGLDKDDEYEADRMGVVLAARAGYDPFGLPACLHTMDAISAEDSRIALLFKTHPLPADRLERLDVAMGEIMDDYSGHSTEQTRFQQFQSRLIASN